MNFAESKPPPAGRGKEKGVAAAGGKSPKLDGKGEWEREIAQSADRGIPLGGVTAYCPMQQYS